MSFKPEEWIFVGDMNVCPHSKNQVDICNTLDLKIKGAILCHEDKYSDSEPCKQVPAFPSFCNVNSQVCISGLRESLDDFNELQKMSDEKLVDKNK
tara:strand:- start:2006 stop:2293 length:288 start_codon:yes stop_codon:yes gene_type:complete